MPTPRLGAIIFCCGSVPKEFPNDIDRMSKKGPLELDEPAERLQEFKASFGSDLAALDNEFLRYMARVK